MARNIQKIEHTAPQVRVLKRVAAYARVSSGKDAMLHSLSAQVSFYSNLIQMHPGWQYIGVYSDEAVTGTKSERPEFQRLIKDCQTGKIDMVITKSISRFARNTVTLLEVVREMKSLGIDVYFEKENIHSTSGDGELMLTILASYAQEESLSVSENCKWRIRNRFKDGEIANWRFMFGYLSMNGKMKIEPQKAAIVRSVFHDYINGKGTTEIAHRLQSEGIPTLFGGKWSARSIKMMLRNEKYAGNALLQKRFVSDHLTKTLLHNNGQLPKYYAEGTHDAIVDTETFQKVQIILESSKEKFTAKVSTTSFYPFTHMIRCANCGKYYKRQACHGRVYWNCATFLQEGKSVCHTKQLPEDILIAVTTEVLGLSQFDEAAFIKQIREIVVPEFNVLIYIFSDGQQIERIWKNSSRSESWSESLRQQARERLNARNGLQ